MTKFGGYRRLLATIIACAGVLLAHGCAAVEHDDELGRAQAEALNFNGLNFNGLNFNGLNFNGLNFNGLGYTGLGYNGLGYDGLNYNGLNYEALVGNEVWKVWMTSPEFTEQETVFDYIVQCALRPEQTIDAIEIDGVVYGPWQGVLGVAPAWYELGNDVQTEGEQERVSACLMAHANAVGVHVQISVMSDVLEPPAPEEREQFWAFEGQFFGNVFGEESFRSACLAAGEVNAATAAQLYAIDRLCAVEPEACEFARALPCSQICDGWDPARGIYDVCGGYRAVGTYVAPASYAPVDYVAR